MKKTTRETRSKQPPETRTAPKVVKSKPAKVKVAKSKPAKARRSKTKAVPAAVTAIALSSDGATWRVALSDARSLRIAAATGLALKIAVGTRWTDALAGRVERFKREQQLFSRAMSLVATSPGIDRATLIRHLGGDADARRAALAVARNGWLA
jgi:hypothetical protein